MTHFSFSTLLILTLIITVTSTDEDYKQKTTYIIHMDHTTMPQSFDDHSQWYASSLASVSDTDNMLYTYNEVIHGYSVRLTAEEATSLQGQPGVLSVLEETRYELLTTRTPQFLGLDSSEMLSISSQKTNNVIIGVLDTGVWPESKSYDDTGYGPVPTTWKGTCETGTNFNISNCNRKLIGARYFSKGYEAAYGSIDPKKESNSPRDDNGHGTHTSTTAAGSPVAKVSLFGYASGTARGIAPHARVATYKVCWKKGGCLSSDIIAGMDMAVRDGVDIMSISIGGGNADYDQDSLAIGAFGAMMKGIFVSASAGNNGPSNILLSNVAPWITTVGASTIDREFPVHIRLGNGNNYTGVSLYSGKPLPKALVPIVYAADVSNISDPGKFCINGSLIPSKIAGKIVICDRGLNDRTQKGLMVKKAGGIGMILANINSNSDRVSDAHLIPTAAVDETTGDKIKRYVSLGSSPMATVSSVITQLNIQPSPVMAGFSSRGPNLITPAILKPDLIAPGVNILAGWTGLVGPSELPDDTRRVPYNIISGTSMSCPHVSGIAALIKGAHPDWSPAAIKSAMMTTAYIAKNGEKIKDVTTGRAANAFDYGAGHVNPLASFDPGLVYDASVEDYLNFLCALNYTSAQIRTVAKQSYTCQKAKTYSAGDLNYPSIAVTLTTSTQGSGANFTVKYRRTLTNVGPPGTYKVSVSSEAPEVKIQVEPKSLTFTNPNEKKSYTVTFTAISTPLFPFKYARLVWSSDKLIVASPIAFNWD